MKNTVQRYFLSVKKILPGWNGADIGHTAARDWYVALLLAVVIGSGLAVFGTLRFLEASHIVNTPPESVTARGFPTDETKILETKNRFDARATEFQNFSTQAPTAPDPGQRRAPTEQAEEGITTSSEAVK